MENLLFTGYVRQSHQHLSLRILFCKHVGDGDCLGRFEIPDMDVVDVQNTFNFLELLLEGLEVNVRRGRLHHEKV
jgi:hypothetical protein